MVYTDLPRPGFGGVFRVEPGHLDGIGELSVFASGTLLYRPIFRLATLNPGLPATASHETDAVPCAVSGRVHVAGATGRERAARVEQGRLDRERVLTKLAGRLVLVNFGSDEAGSALGGVNMFDMFNTTWAELGDNGVITGEEYAATTFPQCHRTVDELTTPFADPEEPVRHAGLALEHIGTRVVRCPFAVAFGEHGDPAGLAHRYIPTLRSRSEAAFAAGRTGAIPARGGVPDDSRPILTIRAGYRCGLRPMDDVHCCLVATGT